jgi:hypothetical protein
VQSALSMQSVSDAMLLTERSRDLAACVFAAVAGRDAVLVGAVGVRTTRGVVVAAPAENGEAHRGARGQYLVVRFTRRSVVDGRVRLDLEVSAETGCERQGGEGFHRLAARILGARV